MSWGVRVVVYLGSTKATKTTAKSFVSESRVPENFFENGKVAGSLQYHQSYCSRVSITIHNLHRTATILTEHNKVILR